MRSAATLSRDATTRSLLDIFHATAVRCPDRVAIDAGDARLTYRDLAERARLLAARLSATGVRPGDLVAVQVASGTSELYLAILGVLESGAAYAPIDADDPPAARSWRSSRPSPSWARGSHGGGSRSSRPSRPSPRCGTSQH
jgi:non-ribosomal peptide synthetase component F